VWIFGLLHYLSFGTPSYYVFRLEHSYLTSNSILVVLVIIGYPIACRTSALMVLVVFHRTIGVGVLVANAQRPWMVRVGL